MLAVKDIQTLECSNFIAGVDHHSKSDYPVWFLMMSLSSIQRIHPIGLWFVMILGHQKETFHVRNQIRDQDSAVNS